MGFNTQQWGLFGWEKNFNRKTKGTESILEMRWSWEFTISKFMKLHLDGSK